MGHMTSAPGPQRPSAAVYRRRRIVVGVAALVILGLIVWGAVAGIGALASAIGGNPEASQSQSTQAPQGSATPSDEASSPSGTPAGANPDGSCPAAAVQIKASTDKASYTAKEKPVLQLELVNTLKVACKANVGPSVQEFIVTSGSDRIFSTKDCQKDAQDYEIQLEPGKTEQANFTWQRNRTQPGCTPVAAEPRPGTYTLQVKLGKTTSEKVQFRLN
ncbi:hypothetical protein DWB68_03265 [Galactobacter valiniphilus]|uniref:Intracellular proteinase inhibitor BsuPI domain-containing protein n=2 Tax=Galactobacter valiniphilus TaxID=2676122 RepID=A0A399JCP4_9MICC|nr:hypothetical protein DWB68_03265 [Galactobacter valiniphilus]